jgi:hypothetical protein
METLLRKTQLIGGEGYHVCFKLRLAAFDNLLVEKVIGINYSLLRKLISLSKISLSHNLAFVLSKKYE